MTRVFNKKSETKKRRALRRSMPKAEVLLWRELSGKQLLGRKFRRQYSVDQYIIDFYCPALRLAIEVDGESHFRAGAAIHDLVRQKHIETYGIEFMRFTNDEVYNNLEGVLQAIADRVSQRI